MQASHCVVLVMSLLLLSCGIKGPLTLSKPPVFSEQPASINKTAEPQASAVQEQAHKVPVVTKQKQP